MENTPTGRADDLPTILGIFKNDPKSRSVNNSLQQLDFDPNSVQDFFTSQSFAQSIFHTINETHKQYSLLDAIFNSIFYFGPPGKHL